MNGIETGDYLALLDKDKDFEPIKEYCGNANGIPITYNSTEPGSLYLQFKTDGENRGVGFILGYKEIGKQSKRVDKFFALCCKIY